MAANVVETKTVRKSQDINSKRPYINQYELISPLGEGMHGKVMLACDTTTDQGAIKVMKRIDPRDRRLPKSRRLGAPPLSAQHETESKIRREIAVMKKCTHQNLVRLLEVIDDPSNRKIFLGTFLTLCTPILDAQLTYYPVMENLQGGEIKWRSRDHEEPVLELSQIQRIMRDVTLGLEYLHHQGIIHRDIKPANLLWTEDRQSVKICDFGVSHFTAAAVQDDPNIYDEAGLTKTAGSPAFFAPEICRIPDISFDGSPPLNQNTNGTPSYIPPITKQIDIWALGVTFYCLLFGKPPWSGGTQYLMFRSICNEDFYVPPTMARDRILTGGRHHGAEGKELGWIVVDILVRLLEKDQERRISLADLKVCLSLTRFPF
ncbi:hypothetical protein M422DRAFT_158332 [Sphaerobolus stellatus SS14]|nr:hypothetical protein M422DRAFT_158332 [Sphaerobolus stellatus SS14]